MEVAQTMISNDASLTDEELEFVVMIAQNHSGGACHKTGVLELTDHVKEGTISGQP